MGERYWEVDAVKGIALVGMIVYHFFACMVMYHMIVEDEQFLSYYGSINVTSASFVLIAGVALILRHGREKGETTEGYYKSIVLKALFLLAIALALTFFSWFGAHVFLDSDAFVKFGFLHMLSISLLLCLPFLQFGKWNIIPGVLVVLASLLVIPQLTGPGWLYPLGIHDAYFLSSTPDYFSLFPWFGVLLIGVALGAVLYPNGVRGFRLREAGLIGRFFTRIGNGKITLAVYLAHIPVIFAILWVVSTVTGIGYL